METEGTTGTMPGMDAVDRRPTGPPMAALAAAAFGTFVLGLFTTFNELSPALHDWLPFREPVGPLSGKTTLAVAGWLVAWAVLGFAWRGKDVDFRKVLVWSGALLALGMLGTFPTFFEQFTAE